MVAIMSYVASNYLVSGERPARYGNGHPNIVPYQSFKAKDGYFAFAAGNDRQWQRFCETVGKDEWAEDPRFKTNADRLAHRQEVIDMLNDLFDNHEVSHWLELCQRIGIAAAPIDDLDQVFQNPQVQAREMRVDVDHPAEGSVPLVGSPLKVPTAPTDVRRAPPTLGQHTDEILDWLGYSTQQVEALRESGAI